MLTFVTIITLLFIYDGLFAVCEIRLQWTLATSVYESLILAMASFSVISIQSYSLEIQYELHNIMLDSRSCIYIIIIVSFIIIIPLTRTKSHNLHKRR